MKFPKQTNKHPQRTNASNSTVIAFQLCTKCSICLEALTAQFYLMFLIIKIFIQNIQIGLNIQVAQFYRQKHPQNTKDRKNRKCPFGSKKNKKEQLYFLISSISSNLSTFLSCKLKYLAWSRNPYWQLTNQEQCWPIIHITSP